ncbi:MAG TPA: translation initiation factor IF-2 N-terminal domain-containing protein, partial [Mycobacteriales bacterium]|nr:translation initiation factor IF-2 N-terminal domain-containing protein [Mycobacteriales bacterium]
MAKARVSALAKEYGLTSKQLIEWLNNNGEYVKSPSSTVEAPVVAKVDAAFPKAPAAEEAPAKKTAAKKTTAKKAAAVDGAAAAEPATEDAAPER